MIEESGAALVTGWAGLRWGAFESGFASSTLALLVGGEEGLLTWLVDEFFVGELDPLRNTSPHIALFNPCRARAALDTLPIFGPFGGSSASVEMFS